MRTVYTIVILLVASFARAQDFALRQLEASPRHQEWVNVQYGDRKVRAFVVYPEVSNKATSVIVIHENRGLNDWPRAMAGKKCEPVMYNGAGRAGDYDFIGKCQGKE